MTKTEEVSWSSCPAIALSCVFSVLRYLNSRRVVMCFKVHDEEHDMRGKKTKTEVSHAQIFIGFS